MANPKFHLKKSKDGQFYFNLHAKNGEIVLTSERYKAKASAKNGIASIKKNCKADKRYERKASTGGKCHFVLKAANHQVIGSSQRYANTRSMENGIAAIKRDAKAAKIEE